MVFCCSVLQMLKVTGAAATVVVLVARRKILRLDVLVMNQHVLGLWVMVCFYVISSKNLIFSR